MTLTEREIEEMRRNIEKAYAVHAEDRLEQNSCCSIVEEYIPRLLTALEEARAERDRLREALEPFAVIEDGAGLDGEVHLNGVEIKSAGARSSEWIDVEDFWFARRALNTEEGEDE